MPSTVRTQMTQALSRTPIPQEYLRRVTSIQPSASHPPSKLARRKNLSGKGSGQVIEMVWNKTSLQTTVKNKRLN